MGTVTLSPYLLFDGVCREAMELYREVFGGTLMAQSYGEVDPNAPAGMKDRVMHASLMGGRAELMAGDTPDSRGQGPGKISLALSGTDEAALREMFDKLSAGGEVVTPIERQVWGDLYGAVTDRYGIAWMVNISAASA